MERKKMELIVGQDFMKRLVLDFFIYEMSRNTAT